MTAVVTARPSVRPPRPDAGRPRAGARPMGYQPSLDGIRAIAVVAVAALPRRRPLAARRVPRRRRLLRRQRLPHHVAAVEERRGSMTTDLKRFWLRRAKRLLPALFAMLVVTCAYAALFGARRARPAAHATSSPPLPYVDELVADRQQAELLRGARPAAAAAATSGPWPSRSSGTSSGRSCSCSPCDACGGRRRDRLVVPIVLVAAGVGGVDGDRCSTPRATSVPCLLRHRHPGVGAADRRGRGHVSGAVALAARPVGASSPAVDASAGVGAAGARRHHAAAGAQTRRFLYRGGFVLVSLLSIVVVGRRRPPGRPTSGPLLSLAPLRWLGSRSLRALPVALARLHGDPPAGLPAGRPATVRAAARADVRR